MFFSTTTTTLGLFMFDLVFRLKLKIGYKDETFPG